MEIEDKSCLMMMSRIGDKCIVDASDDEQSDVLSLRTSQESFFDFFSADIYAEALGDKILGKLSPGKGIEAIHDYIYELHEFDEFWSGP